MPSPPQDGMTKRQARFETLYAASHAPILGYALRRTASPDDAADILAETFLAAWRRLDELPDGDDARLWLYGAARRVLANHHRGERRRSALAGRLRAELSISYIPPEFDGESARLAQALGRLPARQREVLALDAWEGLDYGEIATVLGCSRNAVRIRLHRARMNLAAELAGESAQEPGPELAGTAAQAPGHGTAGSAGRARDRVIAGSAGPHAGSAGPHAGSAGPQHDRVGPAGPARDPEPAARPSQNQRG